MPLNKELAKALHYLRKQYKVSESDLLAIAKTLHNLEPNSDDWQYRMQEYLKQRKLTHGRRRR